MRVKHGRRRGQRRSGLVALLVALPMLVAATVSSGGCVDLLAGQDLDIGSVCVSDDGETLTVVMTTDDGWLIDSSHVAVADDEDGIPQNRAGMPTPGTFGSTKEHDPAVSTTTHTFDLTTIDSVDGELAVAAHVSVHRILREESAWGDGTRFTERGQWATWFAYEPGGGCVTPDGAQDADCDGIPDSEDCAPDDASNANDRDCDGIPDSEDCAPDDASNANDRDCDGTPDDQDCAPDDASDASSRLDDRDCDGIPDSEDCASDDPTIYPGAPEVPNDGIDQDCDGRDLILGTGDIQVTLQWESDPPETVDMDVAVIDPNGETVYWGNRSSASGGQLDRDDDVCMRADDGQSIENIFWASDTAPEGTYTVLVDEYEICTDNVGGPAAWHLVVRLGGEVVIDATGVGDGDPVQGQTGPENTFEFEYVSS